MDGTIGITPHSAIWRGRGTFPASRWRTLLVVVFPLLALLTGCQQGPYGPGANNAWRQPPANPTATANSTEFQTLQARLNKLDANNRDLHAQLARSEQQLRLSNDQVALLKQQLTQTAKELERTQLAKQNSDQQLKALNASTRQRGGATITANNSVTQALAKVDLPGLDARQEDDVIRIEVPADQVFQTGTTQITTNGYTALQLVADAIARHYPKNRVGIEVHADRNVSNTSSPHQLSALQAAAIFENLSQRYRLPTDQMFILAMGANHPRYSSATSAGAARNRRIEFVIYPERWASY